MKPVTAYVGAQGTRRRLGLTGPGRMRDLFAAGLVGSLLVVGVAALAGGRNFKSGTPPARTEAVRILLPVSAGQQAEAARRFQSFAIAAGLSPVEQQWAADVLAGLHDSLTAACAYFDDIEESDASPAGAVGLLTREHAQEVEALVRNAARQRLLPALGPQRVDLLDRYLAPFASFVVASQR
jgi:hypothetical protein